jgi:hypothetical protein
MGNRQWQWQWAMGNGQWAIGNRQWAMAMGNGQNDQITGNYSEDKN